MDRDRILSKWNAQSLGKIVLAATFFGFALNTDTYLIGTLTGRGFQWHAIFWNFVGAYTWLFLLPVPIFLIRRFPFQRDKFLSHAMILLLGGILVSAVHLWFNSTLMTFLYKGSLVTEDFKAMDQYFIRVSWRISIYLALVAFLDFADFYYKDREAELHNSRLQLRLADEEFEALKTQIDPDFIFRTLSSITDLMKEKISTAERVIVRLADYLRLTLDQEGNTSVGAQAERLQSYLDVQQARFKSLTVRFDISPSVMKVTAPDMILQRIVEILIAQRFQTDKPYTMDIEIRYVDPCVVLSIKDCLNDEKRPDVHAIQSAFKDIRTENLSVEEDPSHLYIRMQFKTRTGIAERQPSRWTEDLQKLNMLQPVIESRKGPQSFWLVFIWILLALSLFVRETVSMFMEGTFGSAEVLFLTIPWCLWTGMIPVLLWFNNRFPLDGPRLIRNVMAHFVLSALFWFLIAASLDAVMRFTAPKYYDFFETILETIGYLGITPHLLLFWSFSFLLMARKHLNRYLKRQLDTALIGFQLINARLRTLKMQLHPHFLFNTLHSIIGLLHEDVSSAQLMLKKLHHFLHMSLTGWAEDQHVEFQKEIQFLECYLEIEKIRFQDRLNIRMEIDSTALLVKVPNLILQPLVENAIRHGISAISGAGELTITATLRPSILRIEIADNGPGISGKNGTEIPSGLGLANTRERLYQIYGNAFRFDARNRSGGGFCVSLEIPALIRPPEEHRLNGRQEKQILVPVRSEC